MDNIKIKGESISITTKGMAVEISLTAQELAEQLTEDECSKLYLILLEKLLEKCFLEPKLPKMEICGISTKNDSRTYGCPHCSRPVRTESTPCFGCETAWCSQTINKDNTKRYNSGCMDTCEKAKKWLMDKCEPKKDSEA